MSHAIKVCRTVSLPDAVRLARYERAPELGPRVLFFSGGTALKELSQKLIEYTHNSIHIITPFDSGGSSAELRRHFKMLAVGDVRNRLMALADRSPTADTAIFDLFAYRFPKDEDETALRDRLGRMRDGKDPLVAKVGDPMRKLIRNHLRFFEERMSKDFPLRGASIGNLILAGGFFNYGRHLDPVIYLFSKLVDVKGMVRPVISADLHLVAEMEDDTYIVGQHRITGKEVAPLQQGIKRLYLTRQHEAWKPGDPAPEPVEPPIRNKVKELIGSAECIVYPIGSFWSSLIANLLPAGVGQAVSENECPKIYVPNSAPDPEVHNMGLHGQVRMLMETLQAGCKADCARDALLNFLLVDTKRGVYPEPKDLTKLRRFGVEIIDVDLVDEHNPPYLDPMKVINHVLSIV